MQKTIKARLEDLENQLSSRLETPMMIVVDVVNASGEGPEMAPPSGYTCDIKGRRHYFPGTSDQAVAAARALIDLEPRARGMARPVPVLMACLIAPTDDTTTDASGANGVNE
ncbi:hypothetical protein [Pseudomonas sp. NA-150]|uniref:hypothetical protein n=1 Tax=Pseudomonas sp. NA-150 TaxID=3367525 RepID=UPI0037C9E27A